MTMDCRSCDDRLLELLYGELDEVSAAAVRRHLDGCPACAAAAARIQQTRQVLARLEPVEPPAGVEAIMAAARASAERASRRAPAPEPRVPAGEPGWLERLAAGLRSVAFQPSFVTALVIVIVGALGFFYLRNGAGTGGLEPSDEHLVMVPTSELRAAEPPRPGAAASAPPTFGGVPAPSQELPERAAPLPPAPVEPEPPAPEAEDGVFGARGGRRTAADPPVASRRQSAEGRAARAPETERAPSLPFGSDRNDGVPSQQRELGPIVLDARPVESGAVPPPPAALAPPGPAIPSPVPRAWPGGGAATGGASPAPPRPGSAGLEDRDEQERIGRAETVRPSPAPAGAGEPERYRRGLEAYRAHRYADAADELAAFVRSPSAPGHLLPSGIHHLARSYASMGNGAAAARHYDDVLRRFPDYRDRSQVLLEAARLQARLGNHARASALLSELERRSGWAERARRERAAIEQRRMGASGAAAGPAAADRGVDDLPSAGAAESVESGF